MHVGAHPPQNGSTERLYRQMSVSGNGRPRRCSCAYLLMVCFVRIWRQIDSHTLWDDFLCWVNTFQLKRKLCLFGVNTFQTWKKLETPTQVSDKQTLHFCPITKRPRQHPDGVEFAYSPRTCGSFLCTPASSQQSKNMLHRLKLSFRGVWDCPWPCHRLVTCSGCTTPPLPRRGWWPTVTRHSTK